MSINAVIESVDTCPASELRALCSALSQTCEEFSDELHSVLRQKIGIVRSEVSYVLKELRKQRFFDTFLPPKAKPIPRTLRMQEDHSLQGAQSALGSMLDKHWQAGAERIGIPAESLRRGVWHDICMSLYTND